MSQSQSHSLMSVTPPSFATLGDTVYMVYMGGDNYAYWATSSDGVSWADCSKVQVSTASGGTQNLLISGSVAPTVVNIGESLVLFYTATNTAGTNDVVFSTSWGGNLTNQIWSVPVQVAAYW